MEGICFLIIWRGGMGRLPLERRRGRITVALGKNEMFSVRRWRVTWGEPTSAWGQRGAHWQTAGRPQRRGCPALRPAGRKDHSYSDTHSKVPRPGTQLLSSPYKSNTCCNCAISAVRCLVPCSQKQPTVHRALSFRGAERDLESDEIGHLISSPHLCPRSVIQGLPKSL